MMVFGIGGGSIWFIRQTARRNYVTV